MNLHEFLTTTGNFSRVNHNNSNTEIFKGLGWVCLCGNMEQPTGLKFQNGTDLYDEIDIQLLASQDNSLIFNVDGILYHTQISNQYCRNSSTIDELPPTICLEFPHFNLMLYPKDGDFSSRALGEAYLKRCIQSMKDCLKNSNHHLPTKSLEQLPVKEYEAEWLELIQSASMLSSLGNNHVPQYVLQLQKVLSVKVEETSVVSSNESLKSRVAAILQETPTDILKLENLVEQVAEFEYQSLVENVFKI